ncbi:MAG: PKD domain-containing protein, partial [Deltaproteobacteria bacterium]|nr:PKD domain-containing protein [Deltaproteobacteria bacterium]
NLDDYVADPDNADDEIVWSYSGNSELAVSIIDRVANITAPSADWNGSETITFTATDPGFLFDSDGASFTVTAVNDAPVVSDIPGQAIAEGEGFTTINLDDYVTDVDNADAEINWTYSGNTDLAVSIAARVATITVPDGNWSGSETITFTAEDPGLLSDSDGAMFAVTAVNDAPVVSDIPGQTIAEGESFATINLDNYVSDADNPDAEISWTYSGNTDLTVSIVDRVATISVPSANWSGSETITFTATDPGLLSDVDDAAFTVTAAPNVPPVANAGDNRVVYNAVVLDASGSSDPDGTIVSYEWDIQHRDTPAYNRTATGANPLVSNLEHGFYFVILTVTDDEGATATDEMLLGANHQCRP